MELAPWRPFGELSPFRKEVDRLWDRFLGETPFARKFTESWLPSVDILETKDNSLVKSQILMAK